MIKHLEIPKDIFDLLYHQNANMYCSLERLFSPPPEVRKAFAWQTTGRYSDHVYDAT